MNFDIRDLSPLKDAITSLASLIEACRQRGPFSTHDNGLTNEGPRVLPVRHQ